MGDFIGRLAERLAWTAVAAARSVYAITYHAAAFLGPVVARLAGFLVLSVFLIVRFALEIFGKGLLLALSNLFAGLSWLVSIPYVGICLIVLIILLGGCIAIRTLT
jgi:hypothetical protein